MDTQTHVPCYSGLSFTTNQIASSRPSAILRRRGWSTRTQTSPTGSKVTTTHSLLPFSVLWGFMQRDEVEKDKAKKKKKLSTKKHGRTQNSNLTHLWSYTWVWFSPIQGWLASVLMCSRSTLLSSLDCCSTSPTNSRLGKGTVRRDSQSVSICMYCVNVMLGEEWEGRGQLCRETRLHMDHRAWTELSPA